MSEFTSYNEQNPKVKKKKGVKIKPKTIFGIFCGTFFLFIVSFLLSYMLMNHNLPTTGTKSLAEENEELKARIETLEKRLEKYEDVDDADNFAETDVPEKYSGATITPGGSEPAANDKTDEESEKDNNKSDKKDTSSKNNKNNDKTSSDDEESAFDGVITDDDEVPASTGISDAPVILN